MSRIDRWIFHGHRSSSSSLAVTRVVFALYVLLVGAHDFSWIADIPDVLFRAPPGIMSFLSGFPPKWFLFGVRLGLVLSALCLLFDVGTFIAACCAGTCLLLAYGSAYCTGKVTHNILYVITPLVMAWTRWGTRRGQAHPRYWPVSLLALLLAFLMATAAIPKLLFGWLDTASAAVYAYHLEAKVIRAPLWPDFLSSVVPWEVLDWTTVFFELGFTLALPSARLFRAIVSVAAIFHALVFLMLDISFATNLVVYVMFFDWTWLTNLRWFQTASRSLEASTRRVRLWHCAIAALAYTLLLKAAPLNAILYALGFEDRVKVFATPGDVLVLLAGGTLGGCYLAATSVGHYTRVRHALRAAPPSVG